MKKILCLVIVAFIFQLLTANAILFHESDLFPMVESNVEVVIENQVAIVTTTQKFYNDSNIGQYVKMGFPIPEDASATQLSWNIDDEWHHAQFSATPQDSTIPGPGTSHPYENYIESYLGDTPLYFSIPDGIPVNDTVIVQFSYVQLLNYDMGDINFHYPGNYSTVAGISSSNSVELSFKCEINSVRQIELAYLQNLVPQVSTNDGHEAIIEYTQNGIYPDFDYDVKYSLNLDQLGLSSISTKLDGDVPDPHGDGFFLFLVEPESDTTQVIRKNITLIIDVSGSMLGSKIDDAKSAARYVVNHLNDQDYFNIVSFSTSIDVFQPQHVQATASNISSAIAHIDALSADGNTDISAAFSVSVPQFSGFDDSAANMVVFLTDGRATAGITSTSQLKNHISGLFNQLTASVRLFSFGIGADVNTDVLTAISNENNGMYYNIDSNMIEGTLSDFYDSIRNPVLINPVMTFSDSLNITETYPKILRNLYVGQQLSVIGRYRNPVMESVNFSGTAMGSPVNYSYDLNFADSSITQFQFLTKVWAKKKIEYLMTQYYLYNEHSQDALEIKDTIVQISMSYGVLSPFTSFTGDETAIDDEEYEEDDIVPYIEQNDFVLKGNYPNPFNPETCISFSINSNYHGLVEVKIYNLKGQLVKILAVKANGAGTYSVVWKGTDQRDNKVASGMYMYIIDFGKVQLHSKMILMK